MKLLLFLAVAFVIATVVLSAKEEQHKKKGDKSPRARNHQNVKSHGGKKNRSHNEKRSRSHASKSAGKKDRQREEVSGEPESAAVEVSGTSRFIIAPYCSPREIRVCGGYNCTILTCANNYEEIEDWDTCLFDTENSFTNLLSCPRLTHDSTTKCICRFGLVLDESTGQCVKISDCSAPTTTGPTSSQSTTTEPTFTTYSHSHITTTTTSTTTEIPNITTFPPPQPEPIAIDGQGSPRKAF